MLTTGAHFLLLAIEESYVLCNVGRESWQGQVSHYTSAVEGGCVVIVGTVHHHCYSGDVLPCRVLVALSSRREVTVTAPTIAR